MDTPEPKPEQLPSGLQLTAIDPVFRDRPHEYLDRLREVDPVHRDRQFDRVVLTRFEDARNVLNDRTLAVDPRRARLGSFARRDLREDQPAELSMLHLDDPDHKRLRGLVAQAFNQRSVDAFRPRIRAIAASLLDEIGDRSPFDLIASFAAPLPIIVIAEMLGVDPADQADFKRWSDALLHTFNPARTAAQEADLHWGGSNLRAYFARVVEQRRAARGEDLVSALVAAEEDGERLSGREIIITCNLLLAAGNMTTTDLIGNGVLALLRHPKQLRLLRERPDLARNAVEEMLRYDPPVTQAGRITTSPREIGGVRLETGESISSTLLAAGHDPAVNDDPHRFDITRIEPRHLAFGGGLHYCLGAPLARAEAEIGIPLLLERFPDLALDTEHGIERKDAPVFNGLRALWVRSRRE